MHRTTSTPEARGDDDRVRAAYPARAITGGLQLQQRDQGDEPVGTPEDAMPTLYGHFAVFNVWTEIDSLWEGRFLERLAPGSFAKTFREQRENIRCLFQHGMDPQAGDKPLGPIRELREDPSGSYYEVPLLNTSYCRDLVPGLEQGLYGASFRFRVLREEWVEEPGVSDYNPLGLPERTIKELQCSEFGPVTFGAYDQATAGVRSITDEMLAQRLGGRAALERAVAAADARGAGPRERRAARDTAADVARSETEPTETGTPPAPPSPEPAGAPPAPAAPAETADVAADQHTETVEPEAPSAEAHESAADTAGDLQDPQAPSTADADPDGVTSDRSAAAPDPTTSREDPPMTLEQLRARLAEIRSRLNTIDEETGDAELSQDLQTEHDTLDAEQRTVSASIERIEARREAARARVAEQATDPTNREAGAEFHTRSTRTVTDPFDMSRINAATSITERRTALYDQARAAVDQELAFYHPDADTSRSKGHIEGLLRHEQRAGDERDGAATDEIARRILVTGTEQYQRAFFRAMAQAPLNAEEQRALATFSGSAGGYAVPYQLDPTIIPTSNHSVNPFRAQARVEQITSNEWRGVTSAGVTATYAPEGTEVGDNTPTLAQPVANPERVQSFVPFSIEIEQDWPTVMREMAVLVSDAKDDVETLKFTLGGGHGSNEPEGIIPAVAAISGSVVTSANAATLSVQDVYALEQALGPRFRSRAAFMANRVIYNLIRQFDQYGGGRIWLQTLQEGLANNVPTPGNIGARLLGYPAAEDSAMASTTATNALPLILGDWRNFLIVDRAGMNMELVPHLFGPNGRPTGQRGAYFWWRNTSKVLTPNAFRLLKIA